MHRVTRITLSTAALWGAVLISGCLSADGPPYLPQDTMKYTIPSTGKFVLLDRATRRSVTCTGLQERVLPDGRIEVTANVKNRTGRRIVVQVNTLFEDANGVLTGDNTPFQTLVLQPNATEPVRVAAMNTDARGYTIQVRQTR